MPQDTPDAVSPLAPFSGSFELAEHGLVQRWFAGREVTPELRDEALKVIDIAFNRDVSWYALPVAPADHFDWKVRDRPTGSTVHLTEEADGRLIGYSVGVRRIWHVQGRPYVNRAGYDVSRLPEWQGRGLGRAFQPFEGREWHPSEDLALGYVTHPADRHLVIEKGAHAPANETHDYVRHFASLRRARRAGRLIIAPLGRAARRPAWLLPTLRRHGPTSECTSGEERTVVSNTSRVIRERERPRGARLRDLARRSGLFGASLLARRRAPAVDGLSIETITRFEPQHEGFIEAAMRPFEFIGERSISYLNWRHCDERGGPFTVRLARRHGADVGYAITRVLDGNAYLADILVVPGQRVVAEALIRDAIDLARTGGASFIATTLPQYHPYTATLRRTGFIDVGHVAGELFNMRGAPDGDLAFLERPDARVHHVMADSDVL